MARSPVFRCMLCGDFAEASQSDVEIDYSGEVLQALARHICTDETTVLNEDDIKPNWQLWKKQRNWCKQWPPWSKLCEQAVGLASKMIKKHPDSIIFFLALYDNSTVLQGSSIEEIAFGKVQEKPQILLEGATLGILSSFRREQITKSDHIMAKGKKKEGVGLEMVEARWFMWHDVVGLFWFFISPLVSCVD